MHILRSALGAALLAAPIFAHDALAQNAPGRGAPPVTGVIQSFDGKILTIKADDGSVVAAALAPNVGITVNAKRTVADIKPGDFIASGGTRGPDGVIRANEIRIFSGVRGEGQLPMAQPNQVMTNATVSQVGSAAGTPVIKLTFHGAGAPGSANCTGRASDAPGGAGSGCIGQTQFEVPADVAVVAQLPGNVSMLKPGARASMNVTKGADGSASATRVTIME